MLKFNSYPPKKAGDVEFTELFVKDHRAVQPTIMGHFVANTLMANMRPEDCYEVPEILAHMIDEFPIVEPSRGISAQLYGPLSSDRKMFIEAIESDLGEKLPLRTGVAV
ncbi:MAG TPA: hypothetical protein VHC21_03730 [Candidatus Saccharimonadales bacterium]|nr:hypothetical protein [Candidatus Saccharimonadales bacterium]